MPVKKRRAVKAEEPPVLNQDPVPEPVKTQVKPKDEAPKGPQAGKPLPSDFENPPSGEPIHRCIDQYGRYQPEWSQVFIHKTALVGSTQMFLGKNDEFYRVAVGTWADVPPEVVSALKETTYDQVEMAPKVEGTGLSTYGMQRVVNRIPRFQYSVVPSA